MERLRHQVKRVVTGQRAAAAIVAEAKLDSKTIIGHAKKVAKNERSNETHHLSDIRSIITKAANKIADTPMGGKGKTKKAHRKSHIKPESKRKPVRQLKDAERKEEVSVGKAAKKRLHKTSKKKNKKAAKKKKKAVHATVIRGKDLVMDDIGTDESEWQTGPATVDDEADSSHAATPAELRAWRAAERQRRQRRDPRHSWPHIYMAVQQPRPHRYSWRRARQQRAATAAELQRWEAASKANLQAWRAHDPDYQPSAEALLAWRRSQRQARRERRENRQVASYEWGNDPPPTRYGE